MSIDRFGTKYDRLYVALVTPMKESGEVDEPALRQLIRYFLQPKFVDAGGGLIINPEAGELFFLSQEEKRRNVEITVEECAGKIPLFAGVLGLRTEDNVKVAIDAKKAGVDGLFLMPPMGGMDITTSWNADKYPEVFIDFAKPAVEAVDLPAIVHPSAPSSPAFGHGISLGATMEICKEIPNIVGWKMTYGYEGSLVIAKALRAMDRHIGILRAGAKYYHENLATGFFDGTVSGNWNYAMEPMVDHIAAWRSKDLDKACEIFNSGLADLHHYVSSESSSRLHTKYKVATWLRGLIPLPFMRPPMPQPRKDEVLTLQKLLTRLHLNVIPQKEIDAVMARLKR